MLFAEGPRPMTELEKTVRRWLKLRLEIAELEERRDALRPEIEGALLRAKDQTKKVAGVILSYKEETKRRFNEKKARELLGEEKVDELYEKTPTRVLRVTK